MHRILVSSIVSVVMASAVAAAQAPTPPPMTPAAPAGPSRTSPPTPQQPGTGTVVISDDAKDKETMLTGCLVRGSGPAVFLLQNAKTPAQGASESGKTFIVTKAATADELDFSRFINHKVSIAGSAEDLTVISVPPPVSVETDRNPVTGDRNVAVTVPGTVDKVDEKLLPKLSARTVLSIGDACT